MLKTLFLMDLVGWDAVAAWEGYLKQAAPKSAIEGIWKVAGSGQDHGAVGNLGHGKLARWQWLTIDKIGGAGFCRLWLDDGSVISGKVSETNRNVLIFPGQNGRQTWTFQLRGRDGLAVHGLESGVPVWIQLRRDQSWASLVGHKVHWIQEAPREP